MNDVMINHWDKVEQYAQDCILVAFDGCHKIYMAMDEHEAQWFRENYEINVTGSPEFMVATLKEWYKDSCGLKFIQAVTHTPHDLNEGYVSVIPQGAEDEDEDDEDDDWD